MEYYDLLRAGATRSGGSSGFTPTEAQLTAMNSGIDSEKVEQIETNRTNILSASLLINSDRILSDDVLWENNNPTNVIDEDGCVTLVGNTPTRISTNIRFDVEKYKKIVVKITSGYKTRVLFWENAGDFSPSTYKYVENPNEDDLTTWSTDNRTIIVPNGAKGMSVSIARVDSATINPSECVAVQVYVGTLINKIDTKQDASEIKDTINYDLRKKPISVTVERGAIDSNGQNAPDYLWANSSCRTGYFRVGQRLTISVSFSVPSEQYNAWFINVCFYDKDKNFISRELNEYTDQTAVEKTIDIDTTPSDAAFSRISYTYKAIGDLLSQNILTDTNTPLLRQVKKLGETTITKGVFLGDSISFGVYSYYDNNGDRKNADDDTAVLADTRADIRISDYFEIFANAPMDNIARRGTGYVADTRNLGNAWVKAQITDFGEYDFCALCFGVNDYIQNKSLGDIQTSAEGTIIGNMMRVLNKIYADNPYCKVVVFTPYNTWGQWRDTVGAAQVLYGDYASNYALGHQIGDKTLQDVVDAINSVCAYYGIESVDLSKGNFINRINIKDILVDGLHPTAASMKALASEMYCNMTFR